MDTARYNFETATQGWANSAIHTETAFSTIYVSNVQRFAGVTSLAAAIMNSPTTQTTYYVEHLLSSNISAPDYVIPANTTITFHAFVPVGAPISFVNGFIQEGANAPMPYRSTIAGGLMVPGNWSTLTVTVPADVTPVVRVGMAFTTTASWSGTVYVDSVNW